jgi:hypothetical protein
MIKSSGENVEHAVEKWEDKHKHWRGRQEDRGQGQQPLPDLRCNLIKLT